MVGFGFCGNAGCAAGSQPLGGLAATTNFADVMDLWEVPAPSEIASQLAGQIVRRCCAMKNPRPRRGRQSAKQR